MTKNEIKKAIYKQKPKATFEKIRLNNAYYTAYIETPSGEHSRCIRFEIPVSDMGDADFLPVMEGKLLNRWIVE